ncbi:MAG: hypothetical protein CVT48_02710 [Thermoplasmata archaeon HGW-Thermoplasmata-1]|nr:MAG: hypothetical protein CVT48_02710 [Thermoplasmata archaeon HGW-Thermoplasmata-1]
MTESKIVENDRKTNLADYPKAKLVGYARSTKSGNAVRISIEENAFGEAKKYETKDGKRYAGFIINLERLKAAMNGERGYAEISELIDAQGGSANESVAERIDDPSVEQVNDAGNEQPVEPTIE